MRIRFSKIATLCLLTLCLTLASGIPYLGPSHAVAAAPADEASGAIGTSGPRLRLSPIMAPYQSSAGTRYLPLMVELEVVGAVGEGEKLDTQGNLRQKQACFIIPLVHDRILAYLFKAKLTSADFYGERREILQKNMFDAVTAYVGKGYYINLVLLGDNPPALDPASQTLSVQCR